MLVETPVKSAQELMAGKVTHEQFRQAVVELAQLRGWRCYWTWHSVHSPAGYPDLTMVRAKDHRLIFAELKVGRDTTTRAQKAWLEDLEAVAYAASFASADLQVCVWRPAHWLLIEAALQ